MNTEEMLNAYPFLDAFIGSTQHALHTMAMLEADCTRVCGESDEPVSWQIGARMSVTGAPGRCLALAATESDAAYLVGQVMGKSPDELTPAQLASGLAEILNIIAGGAKCELVGTTYHYQLTTPEPLQSRGSSLCEPAAPSALVFDVSGHQLILAVHLPKAV